MTTHPYGFEITDPAEVERASTLRAALRGRGRCVVPVRLRCADIGRFGADAARFGAEIVAVDHVGGDDEMTYADVAGEAEGLAALWYWIKHGWEDRTYSVQAQGRTDREDALAWMRVIGTPDQIEAAERFRAADVGDGCAGWEQNGR
jgi:hypothetical protein